MTTFEYSLSETRTRKTKRGNRKITYYDWQIEGIWASEELKEHLELGGRTPLYSCAEQGAIGKTVNRIIGLVSRIFE